MVQCSNKNVKKMRSKGSSKSKRKVVRTTIEVKKKSYPNIRMAFVHISDPRQFTYRTPWFNERKLSLIKLDIFWVYIFFLCKILCIFIFLYTILCIQYCYKSIGTGLIYSMSIFIGKWFQFSNKSIFEQFVIMFDIRDSTVLVRCVWHKPGHRAQRTHSMIIRMISGGRRFGHQTSIKKHRSR